MTVLNGTYNSEISLDKLKQRFFSGLVKRDKKKEQNEEQGFSGAMNPNMQNPPVPPKDGLSDHFSKLNLSDGSRRRQEFVGGFKYVYSSVCLSTSYSLNSLASQGMVQPILIAQEHHRLQHQVFLSLSTSTVPLYLHMFPHIHRQWRCPSLKSHISLIDKCRELCNTLLIMTGVHLH